MNCCPAWRFLGVMVVLCVLTTATSAFAEVQSGAYRGTLSVVKFDVSPPLRDIPPIPLTKAPVAWGGLIVDPPGTEDRPEYGPQSRDEIVQGTGPRRDIPDPVVNFNALPNQLGFTPPDPVGDIGPDHYVTMSNVHFTVHNRAGMLLLGPLANNTLWSGFSGQCESQNAGDPIVLYDQFVDRWIMTQFTANAEPGTNDFYNCVAVSTTGDPTGTWHRYQINNGDLFPDYPKYGVGEDAYYISTRDFGTGYAGVGAYALNKQDFINGTVGANSVIYFFVARGATPENVGDGLLPMDIDGSTLPPADSPHYYLGTMDDGGPYGADQDAVVIWEFDVDFVTPANSTFTLTTTVPISPYDTIFPCTGGQGRSCIPQPGTAVGLDHQGYRQRPLHRAAYRNYGTHESIVTNQSVEAAPGISGIRWWEIRSPGSSPVIHQEGTFAPGVDDGVHRWFGSAAMDSAGNIALGYSAANEVTYPSIRYSGRLFTDAPGTMPQGEGEIVAGAGSQLSTGSRWGDYSSLNVDPTDDCTFWYVNEYYPVTSTANWTLRVGAFKFDECGAPGFALSVASEPEVSICTGDEAMYALEIGSVEGFNMPVSLSAMGHPAGTMASFDPDPVISLPGMSILTVDSTGGATPGKYDIEITGMATGADNRVTAAELAVFDAPPATPTLILPADDAIDVPLNPTFEWSDVGAQEYVVEVATDMAFNNIVYSETTDKEEATLFTPLASSTTYYWRVRANNACGPSADSAVFAFTTLSLPGDCPAGQVEVVAHEFDFESGEQGWTHSAAAGLDTWTLSGGNPFSGAQHWHGDDVDSVSDQRLTSPVLAIPSGLSNLTFRFFSYQDLEANPPSNCWDGGILEVSTNGGTNFTQVGNADLLTDPYDGPITAGPNPLSNLPAWCGQVQPYTDSRVDISDLAGENNVVFRFRIGTDGFVGAPGWDIDDVQIVGCSKVVLEFGHGFEDGEGQ